MSSTTVKRTLIDRITIYRSEYAKDTIPLMGKYFDKGYRCVYQGWTNRGVKPGKTYKIVFEKEVVNKS